MKETDKQCEFAVDIRNSPGVQELIHTNRVRLDESQIICQLLLPTLADMDVSHLNPLFPDLEKTAYPNGEELSYNKNVSCRGKDSKQCPHPNSLYKISKREELKRLRSIAFRNYKPI